MARQRLSELVCLLLDRSDAVIGVNSVYPGEVAAVGKRQLWVYRRFLAPGTPSGVELPLITAAFEALEDERGDGGRGPDGMCVLIGDRDLQSNHPEAVWPDTGFVFGGYTDAGRQIRLRYFSDASGPMKTIERPLDPGYRVDVFGETDDVTATDVLRFWAEEGVVPPQEAERRVHEVLLVARSAERSQVVGVCTAALHRIPQLGMDLWYYRVLVGGDDRDRNLSAALAIRGCDLLEQRYVDGRDTCGSGIVAEVQNERAKRERPYPVWPQTGLVYIGNTPAGHHLRVRYFPGARAPSAAAIDR